MPVSASCATIQWNIPAAGSPTAPIAALDDLVGNLGSMMPGLAETKRSAAALREIRRDLRA